MHYCHYPHRELTIVALGDATSGKTELLKSYTLHSRFYKQRFVTNVRDIIVDYLPYEIEIVDVEPDDDYFLLRFHAFEKASVVLLCYSIARRETFQNAIEKWCVEVRRINPNVPIVLVAIGTEDRGGQAETSGKACVSFQEGDNMHCAINAYAFIECSVKHLVGIDDVFIEAVRSTYPVGQ